MTQCFAVDRNNDLVLSAGRLAITSQRDAILQICAHAAKALGIEDHRFMPERYAHRLRLRDTQARMPINQPTPENYAVLSELAGKHVSGDE